MSVSRTGSTDVASTQSTPAAISRVSIGGYLIERLQEHGVRDIFGIPGDYVLAFYAQLEKSSLRTIGCTREDCAGFAADAYARLNGIGAVCVTYCVGGLSLCNSIAGAYAEKSPVVVISGSPGLNERFNNPLLHHRVKDFQTQFNVFRRLCASSAVLRIQRDIGLEFCQTAGRFRAWDRLRGQYRRPVRRRAWRSLGRPRDDEHHTRSPRPQRLQQVACPSNRTAPQKDLSKVE